MTRHGVAIALRDVHRRYGGHDVLRGVSLDVAAGELMAVVGQSGTGKSVLLRQIIGLETPDAGTIVAGGMALDRYRALPPEGKPFRMAIVFQSAALLASLTVRENVALRLLEQGGESRAAISRRVDEALEQVELAGAGDRLPAELSGGMRKRAAIARALAIDPHVILYDEPTAELDPILTEQIGALVRHIRDTRGATQVVVTHELRLARAIADRIAVLDAGRIVECATPDALLRSPAPLVRAFLRASGLDG